MINKGNNECKKSALHIQLSVWGWKWSVQIDLGAE
jgi:hypothetical protein